MAVVGIRCAVSRAGAATNPIWVQQDFKVTRTAGVIAASNAFADLVARNLSAQKLLSRIDAGNMGSIGNGLRRYAFDFSEIQLLLANEIPIEVRRRAGGLQEPLALSETGNSALPASDRTVQIPGGVRPGAVPAATAQEGGTRHDPQ